MIELLAIPAWDTSPTTLAQWLEAFEAQSLVVSIVRDSPQASWIEVNALRLRGYALMDGIKVEAAQLRAGCTRSPSWPARPSKPPQGPWPGRSMTMSVTLDPDEDDND